MCVVSMVIDHGLRQPRRFWQDDIWRREFEDLIRDAREYDRKNNQPDCELDEKRQALKKIADEMGVEIKFL